MEPACAWKRTARAATEALVVAVALAAALAAAAFARAAPSTQPLKALHHDCRDSFTNKFNGNHFVDDSPCCASLHLAPGCAHKAKPRPGKEPDGLDWKMPSRLQSEVRTWTASRGLPPLDEVNPSKWHVNLFLTRNKKALSSCPSCSHWVRAMCSPMSMSPSPNQASAPSDRARSNARVLSPRTPQPREASMLPVSV